MNTPLLAASLLLCAAHAAPAAPGRALAVLPLLRDFPLDLHADRVTVESPPPRSCAAPRGSEGVPTYLRTRTPGVTLTARERALAGVGRCAVRVTMTWHNADTPDRRELLRMN